MENELAGLLSQFIQETLFPLISSIVLALLGVLIQKLSKKQHMAWVKENQELIERAVTQGIGYAEEMAENYAKHLSEKVKPNQKMAMAIQYVISRMPEIKKNDARDYIEGMLAQIQGAGATGDKVLTPQGGE